MVMGRRSCPAASAGGLPSQCLTFLLCTHLGGGPGEGVLRAETPSWSPAGPL